MARVLLADSQPLFNEALDALFTREGAHVVVGRTCKPDETLDMVGRTRPDLLLVDADIALAGRPSLLEQLRQASPDTRSIVLGDERDVGVVLASVKAGAFGVVKKTHGATVVLRTADAVLDGQGVIPRAMLPVLFRRLVETQATGARSPLARLSPREQQVLALLSRGWDNARIGKDLFISQHTVRTHIQNILEKLGMHSKLEAATFAMQRSAELELTPGGAGLGS